MFCPSCGAPIVFEEGSENTFCSHCGSQLHRDDDNIVRKMEHIEKKLEYADRHEEREFELTKAEREKKDALLCIALAIIFGIGFMLLIKFF